jgi:hypothetical protein
MDGLLNAFKFVHMSADIIKFVCSDGELVHRMQRLWFYGFLRSFISGGYQVSIVVVNLEDGSDRLF